jgi:hypothetical protein
VLPAEMESDSNPCQNAIITIPQLHRPDVCAPSAVSSPATGVRDGNLTWELYQSSRTEAAEVFGSLCALRHPNQP